MKNGFFIPTLVLCLTLNFSGRAYAFDPACVPRTFLQSTFTEKKPFEPATYFSERERFSAMSELPAPPPKAEAEGYLAWLETHNERALGEKSISSGARIDQVFKSGDGATQKRLKDWVKANLSKSGKMTEDQARDSLVNLELFLRKSTLDLKNLREYGAEDLTRQWVEAHYLAQIASDGLVKTLKNYGNIRRPTVLQAAYKALNINATRAGIAGVLDYQIITSAAGPMKYFWIQLPDLKLVKIAEKDMALMLTDGIDAHINRVVEGLKKKVATQAVYNGVKTTLNKISRTALVGSIIYAFGKSAVDEMRRENDERKKDEQSDQAIEDEFGPPPPKKP